MRSLVFHPVVAAALTISVGPATLRANNIGTPEIVNIDTKHEAVWK